MAKLPKEITVPVRLSLDRGLTELRRLAAFREEVERMVKAWKAMYAPPYYDDPSAYRAEGVTGCIDELERILKETEGDDG